MNIQSVTHRRIALHFLLNFPQRILLIGLILLCLTVGSVQRSQAHGGVVIDSGFTNQYEWLVSIDPYPTLLGEAMVTLLVYDIATYEPMDDLTVIAYLAPPDSITPCCNPETHRGPYPLIIDPELYPGDYSNPLPFDQAGEWQVQFVATLAEGAAENFTVVVPITINGSMGGSERIAISAETNVTATVSGADAPNADATATVYAANVAEARQQNAAAGTANQSAGQPLTDTAALNTGAVTNPTVTDVAAARRNLNWVVWGALGLIPILALGWFMLRSTEEDEA